VDEIDFDRSNEKLTGAQKLCQKATGLLTWICNIRLDVVYHARKCSRVMSAPNATAVLKMLRVIAQVLIETPHMGKTFTHAPGTMGLEVVNYKERAFDCDKQHPSDFEMVHDATLAIESNKSVGSCAYMYMGAALGGGRHQHSRDASQQHRGRKVHGISGNGARHRVQQHARRDGHATGQADPYVGRQPHRSGIVARCSVGKNSTHFARRINYTQEMCKGDEETPPEYLPAHIPTEKNTVDYLGKLVNATKFRMSVAYNMGTAMEVPPTEENKKRATDAYKAAVAKA